MKHLLIIICAVCFSFTAAVAQDNATKEKKATTETKKLSSAEKKEADLLEAFKTAGITAEEQVKVRVIVDESTAFYKALKADASLSEEDKKAKSKEYSNNVRNPKLNEVIGEAKSKAFRDAQKAQKESAAAAKQ
jgi:hypothetical protein